MLLPTKLLSLSRGHARMTPMPHPNRLMRILVGTLIVFVLSGFGIAWNEPAMASDTQSVKRGDFLRAAISALHVKFVNSGDVPYSGVQPSMVPYVRTAEQYGALTPFVTTAGTLDLQKDITRGEALQVVVALEGLRADLSKLPAFTDVRTIAQKEAVAVSLEKRWMRPLRTGTFGFDVQLRISEEKYLLRKAGAQAAITIQSPDSTIIHINLSSPSVTLPKEELLQQVWNLLNDQYLYKEKLNGEEAAFGAAKGLVDSLKDPYTVFMPPASSKDFQTQLQGEISGIGAQVEQKSGVLTIVAPLHDSPAERAGLQAGDEILSVNGKSLLGLTYEDSVSLVRGPKGTEAKLHIRRGAVEMDVSVIRDIVRIVELETSISNGIAVVTLHQFGQITDREFIDQMTQLGAKVPRAIVFDLRNNPGGLLDAAGIVAGAFLPAKSPYVLISTDKSTEPELTSGDPIFPASIPMVVLVNKGSASAAEIVAGALQDAGRAKLVGEKTFGKGTVQQVLEFSDGSSLKMTIAEWKTPKGRKIDGIGVEPDVTVVNTPGTDAQMQKALDLLR